LITGYHSFGAVQHGSTGVTDGFLTAEMFQVSLTALSVILPAPVILPCIDVMFASVPVAFDVMSAEDIFILYFSIINRLHYSARLFTNLPTVIMQSMLY
jgi:hypothetical protein